MFVVAIVNLLFSIINIFFWGILFFGLLIDSKEVKKWKIN